MTDLTPEQIRLEQERLDLIQKQNAAAKELASTYDKMAKSKAKLTDEEKEILGLTKQLSVFASQIESTTQKRLSNTSTAKELAKSIKELEADIAKNQALYGDYVKKINAEKQNALQNALNLYKQEKSIQGEIKQQLEFQDNIQSEIELLKNSTLQTDRDRVRSLKEQLRENNNTLNVLEKNLKKTIDQKDAQKELYKQLKASKEAYENITAEQQKELNLAKETLKEKKKGEILDAVKEKFRVKEIKDMFTLVGIFKLIVDAALKADEQTTELARSLGIGKDQANGIRQEFVKYSQLANDSFITTTKLLEAQFQLSEQLGVSVKYSGKQAEDFSRLTKLIGLSTEQAGKLARLSVINGTSIENTAKSIIKGSAASQRANRLSVDQRTILKDVANLSEGILIKFKGNPEALGAAVVQAKKLGLTLSEVDKIGESLLNFESSIENELKAELITGRQLNFERARAAALTGDQAELMQEIANQTGSLTDFQNMNVIAQKSLAEAFGLSREEMSKMLLEQEKINKLGDISQMTLDEQLKALRAQGEPLDSALYKQIQQQSAQEKFNQAIEKLQDLIGNLVAGPLGQLIDGFASIASNATIMKLALGAMLGMSITRLVTGLAALVIPLITGAAASVTMMSALTLGVGAIAILASIAGISAAMNNAKKDMSTPPETKFATGGIVTSEINNATVGEAGPEAIIPLNSSKADKILGGGNINLTPMIAAINEVRNAVKESANRPSVAYIDGENAFVDKIGKNSNLSTSQMKNTSYRLA